MELAIPTVRGNVWYFSFIWINERAICFFGHCFIDGRFIFAVDGFGLRGTFYGSVYVGFVINMAFFGFGPSFCWLLLYRFVLFCWGPSVFTGFSGTVSTVISKCSRLPSASPSSSIFGVSLDTFSTAYGFFFDGSFPFFGPSGSSIITSGKGWSLPAFPGGFPRCSVFWVYFLPCLLPVAGY